MVGKDVGTDLGIELADGLEEVFGGGSRGSGGQCGGGEGGGRKRRGKEGGKDWIFGERVKNGRWGRRRMRRSGGGRSRRGFESGETVEREGGCGGGGSLECGWRNHFLFSGGAGWIYQMRKEI